MQLLYKTARQILNNDEDIADAIQETILTCWEKLDKLSNPNAFKGWLMKILVNKCYDQIRKKGPVDFTEAILEIETFADYDQMEWCRQPFLAVTRASFSGQSGPYFTASF